MKKTISFLTIILLLWSCSLENKKITIGSDSHKSDIVVSNYFKAIEAHDYRKSYSLFSERYKDNFKKSHDMSYLQAYDNISYISEVHDYDFSILKKYFKNNAFHYKISFFSIVSDAPGIITTNEIVITVKKLNNQIKIDQLK